MIDHHAGLDEYLTPGRSDTEQPQTKHALKGDPMSTIRIRKVRVVTLDDGGRILRDSDIVIQNGRITHLGAVPPDLEVGEIVDGSGKAALPGLVNSHCHSPMTFERGWKIFLSTAG